MAHLTINPNSANAWVVILKEGENTFGRADDNDVRVEEGGVSSHHCKVILDQGVITILDLNSTNGTSINGARVAQAVWPPGQIIHLGNLPVRLEGAQPTAPAVPMAAPAPPIPVALSTAAPTPAAPAPMRLRISGSASHPEPAATPAAETPVADLPPPIVSAGAITAPTGTRCKSHPKSPPNWHCPKCRKYYCHLCITTRPSHSGALHLCRACGGECQPVQTPQAADGGERGFFAHLPGAFIYPLRGTGVLTVIAATLVFAALGMVTGLFSIMMTMAAIGYLFLFVQNIIHCTAAGDDEMPSLPDFDGLFGAFFTLAGTVAFCFFLPIGLIIAKFFEVDIPTSAVIATIFLSLLYFPMAFLSVAMNDSAIAANPLVVIPAILKMPLQYLVTAILLCGVFGVRLLGDSLASAAGQATMTTTDMSVMFMAFGVKVIWSFISIYLLTVGMRILGILYVTQKEKFGWF